MFIHLVGGRTAIPNKVCLTLESTVTVHQIMSIIPSSLFSLLLLYSIYFTAKYLSPFTKYSLSQRENVCKIVQYLIVKLFYLVAKFCPTLCHPMDSNTPGSFVLHYLPEFSQILVHWVGDAIQLFHPLPLSSPFACNLSSLRVFSAESALHIRWPKYWSFSFSPSNEYSQLISLRIDWLLAIQGTLKCLL